MVKNQIGELEIPALAIPMVQYEFLIVLRHLLTNRADSILHSVYSCHESGCAGLNLLFIAILKVLLPLRIEWVGRRLYFDMPLPLDQLPNLDQTCACVGVGKSPALSLFTQKVALGDPASGFVGMAAFAPSVDSPTDKTVDFAERLSTDYMPMIVRPAAQYGVEFVDEFRWCRTFMAFAQGSYFLFDRLETGSTRRDLQFACFAVSPFVFPDGLSQKLEPFTERRDLRLLFREADASFREKRLNVGGELFQHVPAVGGDDEVIRISDEVDVVFPAEVLRFPLYHLLQSIEREISNDR